MSTQDSKTTAEPDTSWIARPGPEHRWLERLVGEWEFTPPAPPGTDPGEGGHEPLVLTFRSLQGIWFVGESPMPVPDGTTGTAIMTLGYDPARERFVGTWVGSMMSHLWVYDGELDPAGRTLSLLCEGPDMSGSGRMVPYRDSIEWVSDDVHVLHSAVQEDNGGWKTFMSVEYRRKK